MLCCSFLLLGSGSTWSCCTSCLVGFLLLFYSTEAWIQGLHLEPLHQPYFCEGFFEVGFRRTIYLVWLWTAILLISASWVARITGVSHQCPPVWWF
jgi:hypothetical protein